MSANPFRKATKQAARLRLALAGPAGSGKTYTALTLATELGKRVAVIDTERGSASKYADLFSFDALEITDSFHPRRYIEAIKAAEAAGYDVLVIDSLSHAWVGKEGGLDLHDQAVIRQKQKNAFAAWAEVTPHHMALVDAILQSGCHVIATLRTKTEYVQDKDANGRPQVRKLGTAPLMRDGIEYEFDVAGDMDLDHSLTVTKSRCPALSGKAIREPGAELARELAAWLGGAAAPAPTAPTVGPRPGPVSVNLGRERAAKLQPLLTQLGLRWSEVARDVGLPPDAGASALSEEKYLFLLATMRRQVKEMKPAAAPPPAAAAAPAGEGDPF